MLSDISGDSYDVMYLDPTHLGTPKCLIHSGVPQLPQDKSPAVWEVTPATGRGQVPEEATLSPPPPLGNSPQAPQTPGASPAPSLGQRVS